MRVYALALEYWMTVGYGCVARMAVAEVRPGRTTLPPRCASTPDTVWWGGKLAPVTVEAERPPRAPCSRYLDLTSGSPAVRDQQKEAPQSGIGRLGR